MHGIAHDVTQVLPCAGRDIQQSFCRDTFQQVDEMTGVEFRHWQMTNYRKNMIVDAGKQTGGVVL